VGAAVNWDFIVLFGTIMFFAMLHVWSPDGRQWRDNLPQSERPSDTPALDRDPEPATETVRR
jgi:hypothetical protein